MRQTPALGIDSGQLAEYNLPDIDYTQQKISEPLSALWDALAEDRPQQALHLAEQFSGDAQANGAEPPVLAARAAALLAQNDLDGALKWAKRSLEKRPGQWLSTRIVLRVYVARQAYDRAYELLEPFAPEEPPAWDAPLDEQSRNMALASWAAHCRLWNQATDHLLEAHPGGLPAMSHPLQCDLLRLALSANRAEVAGRAAGQVIETCSDRQADTVLQSLVHKEWLEEALPLYEQLAERSPGTPWIRRRLIGLFLRVGAVEQAREVHEQLKAC